MFQSFGRNQFRRIKYEEILITEVEDLFSLGFLFGLVFLNAGYS